MKARLLVPPAAAVLAALIGASCQRAPDPARPARRGPARAEHLLLITIDTLRADHVGAYGYAAARTPSMDALARRGVRFDGSRRGLSPGAVSAVPLPPPERQRAPTPGRAGYALKRGARNRCAGLSHNCANMPGA